MKNKLVVVVIVFDLIIAGFLFSCGDVIAAVGILAFAVSIFVLNLTLNP